AAGRHVAAREPERVAVRLLLLWRHRRRDGDVDGLRRRGREADRVRVERADAGRVDEREAATLADRAEAGGLLDDDLALRRTRDRQIDAVREQTVVDLVGRPHEVVDRAGRALDVARHDVARD